MYPSIITETGEYNVPYINKLLDFGTLDPDEFKKASNYLDPEYHHNCMQLLAVGVLILSGCIKIIEHEEALRVEIDEE